VLYCYIKRTNSFEDIQRQIVLDINIAQEIFIMSRKAFKRDYLVPNSTRNNGG